MNKILTSLIVGLALVFSARSETATYTLNGTAPTNMIVFGPLKLNSIAISSTSATNGTVYFYDSPYLTNTLIVAAYTNITQTTDWKTNTYTDIFGRGTTNRYQIKTYTTNTVASGARTRQLIATVTTTSNTVSTLDFDGTFLGFGLLATNLTTLGGTPGSVVITVNYDKYR
jgi:hypothetical protein